MKSIGISDDLPDYLQSKYSVFNPHHRASSASKAYRSELRQGISSEAPNHFQVSHVPILTATMKNQAISKQANSELFLSSLKKNTAVNKPVFQYSEIKSQKFDFDTLGFVEGLDVKAGNSARVQRAMAYSAEYSNRLRNGFGIGRGDFLVGLNQIKAPRYDFSELTHLVKNTGLKPRLQTHKQANHRSQSINFEALSGVYTGGSRNTNTPNRSLRKRKPKLQKEEALDELDAFEKEVKHRTSFCMSTLTYRDY
jgi:hypothetical protein